MNMHNCNGDSTGCYGKKHNMLTNGPHTGYYYTPPAEVTSQGYFRLYIGVVAPEERLCGLYKK